MTVDELAAWLGLHGWDTYVTDATHIEAVRNGQSFMYSWNPTVTGGYWGRQRRRQQRG